MQDISSVHIKVPSPAEVIRPEPTKEHIGAPTTHPAVIATAKPQVIMAALPCDVVIPAAGQDHVATRPSADLVTRRGSYQEIRTVSAFDHLSDDWRRHCNHHGRHERY